MSVRTVYNELMTALTENLDILNHLIFFILFIVNSVKWCNMTERSLAVSMTFNFIFLVIFYCMIFHYSITLLFFSFILFLYHILLYFILDYSVIFYYILLFSVYILLFSTLFNIILFHSIFTF